MFSELLQQAGLSIDRLHSFCLVADAGGVTKAAKGDPARQSLYSRQIGELEEFFGVELVRRKGRGVMLTDAGANLQVIAREYLASLSDFRKSCKGQPVEVVIGTGNSILQWLLLPRLQEIRRKLPLVRFKFLNLTSDEAVRRLSDGQADFAIVREETVSRRLVKTKLGVMGYSLFVPASLKAVTQQQHSVKILDNLPLATLEGEGDFREALAEVAKKNQLNLDIQVECSSFTLAARAVTEAKLAAILPNLATGELRGKGTVQVSLNFLDGFRRSIYLASNPRLIRIRPSLQKIGTVLAEFCRFD